MLNDKAVSLPPVAPAWGSFLEPEPTPPAWLSANANAPHPDDDLKVVVTTLSSVRPRSLPPDGRSPSMRPSHAGDLLAEVELAGLRSPSLPAVEALSMELAAKNAELREVVENAAEAVRAARRQALETSEESLVRLACVIADRVVGRELATDPSIIRGWVREGIETLATEDAVEVRVAPQLSAHLGAGEAELGGVKNEVDVVVDDRLEATQIEIRGRYGRVAAGMRARLDAVRDSLGLEEEP